MVGGGGGGRLAASFFLHRPNFFGRTGPEALAGPGTHGGYASNSNVERSNSKDNEVNSKDDNSNSDDARINRGPVEKCQQIQCFL
jgi:hypothetical protein